MHLKMPPLVATSQTPADIIGPHNMDLLRQHVKGYEERASKPSYRQNQAMAEMITRLQAHGYYIDGIDRHGDVCFRFALKGAVQRKFEVGLSELQGMAIEDLSRMARAGYRGMKSKSEFGKLKN